MTAKEKAREFYDKFTFGCRECDFEENARQSAIIAVDEILKIIWYSQYERGFWEQVKNELNLL